MSRFVCSGAQMMSGHRQRYGEYDGVSLDLCARRPLFGTFQWPPALCLCGSERQLGLHRSGAP